jgi:hypothetical protein
MFKKKMMSWTGRMDKGTMMIHPNNKVKGQQSGTLYRWRVQHRRDEGRRGSKKIKKEDERKVYRHTYTTSGHPIDGRPAITRRVYRMKM